MRCIDDPQATPLAGGRNPVELAKLRNGRIKASEATIAKSLGRFHRHRLHTAALKPIGCGD
jgi:hypothetical protein